MSISICMFFSLSKEQKSNFPLHFHFKKLVLNTDEGWKVKKISNFDIVYKGYCDFFDLDENLSNIIHNNKEKYTGNFCIFVFTDKEVKIINDFYRSFPIFYDDNQISNLIHLANNITCDKIISCDYNLNVFQNKINFLKNIEFNQKNEDDVINALYEFLNKKIYNFFQFNKLPVKSFLSGGIDSMLVYSFVSKFTEVELLTCEHMDYDYFLLKNHRDISKNWSYTQIHHYKEPVLLTTGAPGDEFMLRSPFISNLFCKANNTSIIELLDLEKYKNCLHKFYYSTDKHLTLFKKQTLKNRKLIQKNPKFINYEIYEQLINDYQHHHLGNTITYTPLRDLEITKLLLELPNESIFDQIMDSKISKKLIEMNNPKLLKNLSTYKNSFNHMENLTDLLL